MGVVYEEKTVTETKKIAIAKTCDLCGHQSPQPYGDDWKVGYAFDRTEILVKVIVKHDVGVSYPECGNSEEFKPIICPTCFKDKVVPALRALGLKTEYIENSW